VFLLAISPLVVPPPCPKNFEKNKKKRKNQNDELALDHQEVSAEFGH
jgi:hypothetical protein